ncbi:hypothetical protein D3C85_1780710 [compost metagenome]
MRKLSRVRLMAMNSIIGEHDPEYRLIRQAQLIEQYTDRIILKAVSLSDILLN